MPFHLPKEEHSKASAVDDVSRSWRVPAIDGLRALAILMIFAYHAWQFAGHPAANLALGPFAIDLLKPVEAFPAGVDLFMVLSGFCLFLPLCRENGLQKWQLRTYFVRRLRRIAPPYYAAIAYAILLPQVLVVIFRAVGAEASWQPTPSAWQIITHAFFIHTLFVETWSGINGSFWSLGLEAQFYLAFPLAVWAYARWGSRAFLAILAVSILYRIALTGYLQATGQPTAGEGAFVMSIFFLGRWMQFALGMIAAWLVSQHWKREQQITAGWGSVLIAGGSCIYVLGTIPVVTDIVWFPMRDVLLAVAFSVVIVALCASGSPLRMPFENRVVTWLGFISYSLFLIHQPTLWYLSEFLRKMLNVDGLTMMAALCTGGLLLIAGISYAFFWTIERPFLNTTGKKPAEEAASGGTPASSGWPVAGPPQPGAPIVQDQSLP